MDALCEITDNIFHNQKRDMTSSVTWSERFEYFSSFLKYIFRHKLASFCCFFSTNLYNVLFQLLFHFQSRKKRKLSQKFKSCVNWPILQIKIEKETFSWDCCKILFQLNCLFTKINVQRLLIKENLKIKRMYLSAILFFFIPGREVMYQLF